jgi:ABC-type iron transport system FetAB ATPase subunit
MNRPDIDNMMRNVELMRQEIVDLWNAIFAAPEEDRQPLRARYADAYEEYRRYQSFVRKRIADESSGERNRRPG